MTTLTKKKEFRKFSKADIDLIISGVPLSECSKILKRSYNSINCASQRAKSKRKAEGLPVKKFNNYNRPSATEQAKIITDYHLAKASENEQARNKKIKILKSELVTPTSLTKIKVPIISSLEIPRVKVKSGVVKNTKKVLTHKFRINGTLIEVDTTALDIHIGSDIMEVNF